MSAEHRAISPGRLFPKDRSPLDLGPIAAFPGFLVSCLSDREGPDEASGPSCCAVTAD